MTPIIWPLAAPASLAVTAVLILLARHVAKVRRDALDADALAEEEAALVPDPVTEVIPVPVRVVATIVPDTSRFAPRRALDEAACWRDDAAYHDACRPRIFDALAAERGKKVA
jgi:hypothetical protein